jgi:hypothetical protein
MAEGITPEVIAKTHPKSRDEQLVAIVSMMQIPPRAFPV